MKTAGKRDIRRGRPSTKDRVLAQTMVADAPEGIAPGMFPKAGSPYGIVPALGVEEKFQEIGERISWGLRKSLGEAATRFTSGAGADLDLSKLRPWASQDSHEKELAVLDSAFSLNEAAIGGLVAHLVEHLVIREDVRMRADEVRRDAAERTRRIPQFIEGFALDLVKAGVVAADVRDLSKARFAQVCDIIRGFRGNGLDGSPEIPDAQRGSTVSNGYEGVDGTESTVSSATMPGGGVFPQDRKVLLNPGISEEEGNGGPDASVEPLAEAVTGPSEEEVVAPVPDSVSEASPPVPEQPLERWDVLDIDRMGYAIEEVQASTDQEVAALRMRLPEMDSLREMALGQGMERTLLDNVEKYGDLGLAERLVRSWAERSGVRLSDDAIKVWVFLLVVTRDQGRLIKREDLANFDGLVLPGRKGGTRVRKVFWMGG